MKVLTVAGTRPNIIQEMLINKIFKKMSIKEILVHSGQHSDYIMSKKFFEEFELPDPNYHLNVPNSLPGKQIAAIMSAIEDIIIKEKITVTLVHGDVNSTLAAALVSVRHNVPVAHIEAGLRTPFLYNPEEINRRLSDHLSELLFPHIKEAYDSLIIENFPHNNVFLVGDIVKDTLIYTMNKFNISIESGDYCVATIHRAENIKSKERMEEIISGLIESEEKIIFPIHPHTKLRLREYGILEKIKGKNLKIIEPLGYKDFVALIAKSKKVITDSGGVRREAYILGKPVIVAIEIIWVPSMVKAGWSVIAGANRKNIAHEINNFSPKNERPNIFGNGDAAIKIVNKLVERYS